MPSLRQPAQFSPGLIHMFAARSGWAASMPVSITPTTTDFLPVVTPQARSAPMSAPGVPAAKSTVWPVLLRPHSFLNWGSFGTGLANRWIVRSGST